MGDIRLFGLVHRIVGNAAIQVSCTLQITKLRIRMAHSPAAADDLTRLREYIQPLQPLREAEWEAFSAGWTPLQVKRKTVLTAAGETERYLYFVLEGVQRIYHIGERGQEATLIFTYPSSFSGVVDSMLTQTTSTSFFESLTSSRLLRLDVRQLESLIRDHAGIRDLVLKTTALALKGVLQRQAEWILFSAEEKFKTLLRRSPHLLQLVPHKYLASYLGIDPTTFSKLLASVRV